uniref:Solute carrier family 19 member 3 n=1 Tax=Cynoglossus semilaevis TaxID=244447 RepID=A0A3P8UQ20_CYNSE
METVERWRSSWKFPTTLLCFYGFFSTVKPLEPFLFAYLTGPDKNLTAEQVNNQILPVWTYSYLSALVPVFLLTDWLRYKPVVMSQGVALFLTTALLLWTKTTAAMQAMQFFYGVVTASDVAYFSYIYSVIDHRRYRKATSYCRSVQLLGYTVGSVLGQLLVSFDLMSYNNILVMTLVLTAVALFVSCLLPMPQRSMFFHRRQTPVVRMKTDGDGTAEDNPTLWRNFCDCYTSRKLLYWSAWWALATCGYNLTVNYVQVLWEHVQPSQNFSIYNGGVEAVSNLMSAATAYGIGFTQVRWETWGELALGGFSGLGAAALFLMTFSSNIWLCYAAYIVFKSLYMLLITIATFQVAAGLSMERYALMFGTNSFGGLALQTIITAVVVDSRGLGLAIIPQFTIYSSYYATIAFVFSLRGLFVIWREKKKVSNHDINPAVTS